MSSAVWPVGEGGGDRLARGVGILAGRLARLLASAAQDESLAHSYEFLQSSHAAAAQGRPLEFWSDRPLEPPVSQHPDPIDRVISHFQLSRVEVELLLLAAMPDEHEGYSAVLRSLHPRGESYPTVGLAAQLLFPDADGRQRCRAAVEQGALFRRGIVRVFGDAPFFDRSLIAAEALWPALHNMDVWPAEIVPLEIIDLPQGFDRWFAGAAAQRAIRALSSAKPCTIAVTCDDITAALHRAAALVMRAGQRPAAIALPSAPDASWAGLVELHTKLRDAVPVLRATMPDGPASPEELVSPSWSGPLVLATAEGAASFVRGRSLISVPVEPLTFSERRRVWSELVPQLLDSAAELASRYPLEPFRVAEVGRDMLLVKTLEARQPTPTDVSESLRARAHRCLSAGMHLVRPTATWDDLVLSRGLIAQLQEAADRLLLQSCVLDEWGFLRNRRGARGVRLLFAGAPGTGKTLSAEVLAHALHTDLLIVDVSRVVSKWIGETEKNLARVFDAAESSQAVLLFDEADALFARRTEVSDAHDRYANLETAYLLQRLERFEGLAILATNLRQNIDAGFVRRLEFVLEFSEPDREQRAAIWKRHVPADVPVHCELNYHELAALYPVVGGVIRNAAVAAAFRAAADGKLLCRHHFIHAIQREYEKAGKAFPGVPAGMRI